MEKAAVVHNPDNYFFYSTGRDTFTVKLMAKAGDVSLATIHYRDKYIPLDKLDTGGKVPMRRVAVDGLHDYYEAELNVNMLCIRYFFELTDSRGEVIYYENYSFYDRMPECIEEMFDCPQLSREEERYEVPEWARGKVVYQIFVDRFATDKNVPAVSRGEVHWMLREGADRLLCWEAELSGEIGVAVAVNCGGDTQDCSEWAGRRIAASEAAFDGILEPFQAVVLEKDKIL